MALGARERGFEHLIVPRANAAEAALVEGLDVLGINDLGELVGLLRGDWHPDPPSRREPRPAAPCGDLADVRGQADAKRALEIAAAGGHNLLMIGPPGAGKTMLARRLRGILPPPDFEEAVEITRIHSVAGLSDGRLAGERPFRAPHHTISASGLVGGGATPRAGELTLAHRGVLFLDELPEFSRLALEALRQPLETRRVEVMRGTRWATLPAAAMVVAACNRCPCGRPGDCQCNELAINRYRSRLSAPFLDRLDLICEVSVPRPVELDQAAPAGESSAVVRARVVAARERQLTRLAGEEARSNAEMDGPGTRRFVPLRGAARARIAAGREHGDFSARGHDRVLRVARTIADLDGRDRVTADDVDEALAYRVDDPLAVAA
jgi:magnesium chelatase family protein